MSKPRSAFPTPREAAAFIRTADFVGKVPVADAIDGLQDQIDALRTSMAWPTPAPTKAPPKVGDRIRTTSDHEGVLVRRLDGSTTAWVFRVTKVIPDISYVGEERVTFDESIVEILPPLPVPEPRVDVARGAFIDDVLVAIGPAAERVGKFISDLKAEHEGANILNRNAIKRLTAEVAEQRGIAADFRNAHLSLVAERDEAVGAAKLLAEQLHAVRVAAGA